VAHIIERESHASMDRLVRAIMAATYAHGAPNPQADDITIVLVRRIP